MAPLHSVLFILCLALSLTVTTAARVPLSRRSSTLAVSPLLNNDSIHAFVGLTGSPKSLAASNAALYADNSSTGSDRTITLGVGQAFITLALILLVVGAVMGAVWYRHRQRDGGAGGAGFSFSMPSFRRSAARTHGSGAVGGGGGSERLLSGQASDDALLRNRPGGHSLV